MNIHPIAAKLLLTVAFGGHVDGDLLRQADALTTNDLRAMPANIVDLLNIIYGSDPRDPSTREQLQEIISGSLIRMLLDMRTAKVLVEEPESCTPNDNRRQVRQGNSYQQRNA